MWFLPTTGRQAMCQEVLDACAEFGSDKMRGVVIVDGDDYPDLHLPTGWTKHTLEERKGMCQALNAGFKACPDEDSYGFLSDDTMPSTRAFDLVLELTAGHYGMASSNDLNKGGSRMAGGLCFGGGLLRALGWWCPRDAYHLYIDDVWEHIGRELGCWRYRDDVVIEHRHPSVGKRDSDATDRHRQIGKFNFAKWRDGFEMPPELLERANAA